MAPFGGFDHNSHGLRIVTELERRYADFDGLNLSFETLEGLVKHNGPLVDARGAPLERWRARGVPAAILACDQRLGARSRLFASLEAQAAALADDIAYDAHDIDDGLRAGLFDLPAIRDGFLRSPGCSTRSSALHPGLERPRVIHELGRRIITRFIEDAIAESRRRIAEAGVRSIDDVRAAGRTLVGLSAPLRGGGRRDQGVSVRQHVSPGRRDAGARRWPIRSCAACSPLSSPTRRRCRANGRQGARDARGRPRARGRRLYRRDDRPLRHRRTSAHF